MLMKSWISFSCFKKCNQTFIKMTSDDLKTNHCDIILIPNAVSGSHGMLENQNNNRQPNTQNTISLSLIPHHWQRTDRTEEFIKQYTANLSVSWSSEEVWKALISTKRSEPGFIASSKHPTWACDFVWCLGSTAQAGIPKHSGVTRQTYLDIWGHERTLFNTGNLKRTMGSYRTGTTKATPVQF